MRAPVARLEHLLLMYLYSNQPKHLGDFARIVTEREVDLGEVEPYLADVSSRDARRAARARPGRAASATRSAAAAEAEVAGRSKARQPGDGSGAPALSPDAH